MSVNYHAAQSRGVLFENHEKVCEQWRQEFSHYDPARMINTLHLETDWEYLYLRCFQRPYRLCLENGAISYILMKQWLSIISCIIQRYANDFRKLGVQSGDRWSRIPQTDHRSTTGSFCQKIFWKDG